MATNKRDASDDYRDLFGYVPAVPFNNPTSRPSPSQPAARPAPTAPAQPTRNPGPNPGRGTAVGSARRHR